MKIMRLIVRFLLIIQSKKVELKIVKSSKVNLFIVGVSVFGGPGMSDSKLV